MGRWVTNRKVSATEIASVAIENTGRSSRTDTVIARTSGGAQASATLNQAGAAEFITAISESSIYLPNSASPNPAVVNFQFYSNSSKVTAQITSALSTPWLSIAQLTANGQTITSGQAIPNDPGATNAYTGGVKLSYTANETSSERTAVIRLTINNGSYIEFNAIQYAASSQITLSPSVINFSAKGGANVITVTATDDWTLAISGQDEW